MAKRSRSSAKSDQVWEIIIIILLLVFIGLQGYKLYQKMNPSAPTSAPLPSGTPAVVPTLYVPTDGPTDAPSEIPSDAETYFYALPTSGPAALAAAVQSLNK